MKLKELFEMTMKAGNLAPGLKHVFDHIKLKSYLMKHVGDIETIKVYKLGERIDNEDFYLLEKNSTYIAYFSNYFDNDFFVLNKLYSEVKNEKIFEKIIWFIKRNLNTSKIMLGDVHSSDTVSILDHLNKTKRFDIKWYDLNTNEFKDYDKSLYRTDKPANLRIVLENDGDFSLWPNYFARINEGYDSIKSHYDWLVEE